MKFPIEYEVGEVRGDQALACHCYTIALQGGKQSELCPMDELDVRDDLIEKRGEPIDNLILVSLNDWNENHRVQICSNLKKEVKGQLVTFLQRNVDVFAWIPADMPWIDAEVMEHYPSMDHNYQPMKQKKHSFAPKQ